MISTIHGQGRSLMSLVAAFCLSFGATACSAQEKADDLKALQKERRELLSELSADMRRHFAEFRLSFPEVAQVERDSFKADLDYFDKSEDRVSALEEHRKAADELLEIAKVLMARGRGLSFGVSQARAYVLEIQIALVKEKEKQRK